MKYKPEDRVFHRTFGLCRVVAVVKRPFRGQFKMFYKLEDAFNKKHMVKVEHSDIKFTVLEQDAYPEWIKK